MSVIRKIASRLPRLGALGVALVVLNEIRGAAVAAGLIWTFLHH